MGDRHDEPPEAAPRGRAPLKPGARGPQRRPRAAKRAPQRAKSFDRSLASPSAAARDATAAARDATNPAAPRRASPRTLEALYAGSVAEAQEKSRRLETLTALAQTLSATLTLEDVLQKVVAAAVGLFAGSLSRVWLVDDDGQHLSVSASAGARASIRQVQRIRFGEGLIGEIVTARAPVIVGDIIADGRAVHMTHVRAEGIASFAGAPLIAGDRVLGVLYIATRERHAYSAEEVRLLESLATHGAIAIANARLYTQAQARQAHLGALLEINKKISALAPTQALLTAIAEEAARLLEVDNAGFRLLEGDDLVLAGVAGSAGETMIRERMKVGESFSGRVVAAGRTLTVSVDEMAESLVPEHLAADRRLGYTNFLGVPIRAADRVIGVLACRARRPFTPDDQALAEAFAAQAAVALENTRLYQETERGREDAEARGRRLTALSSVTQLMTSAAPREEVFEAVARAATTLLGAKAARVWVDDPGARVLRSRGGVGVDERAAEILRGFPEIPYGRGLTWDIFRSGHPEYVADIQQDPRWYNQRLIRELDLHAFMGLPLATGDRLVGVLSMLFGESRTFTAEDRDVANLLANQAGVAISNAELYEAIELRASRLRTLARLSQLVSSSLDPDEVLTGIARATAEIMSAPFVCFWQADHTTQTLELKASSWPELPADFGVTTLQFGQGAVGSVAVERATLNIENISEDGRFVAQEWARRAGFGSFVGVPIVFREVLLGVLVLIGREPFRFSADDRELLDTFVGHSATAMRNAGLYREAREYADRLRAVEEVNRLVSSSLNVDEVVQNIARAVARFFDAPYVSIWVVEPGGARLRRSIVHSDVDVGTPIVRDLALGESAVGWAALHRTPILWADVNEDPRVIAIPHLSRAGLRYLTAYPIMIGDRLLGVFSVSRATPSPETPETLSLLGSLAAQAAVALDHARLYSETSRRLTETAALLEVAEILGSTLDARQLLKQVAIKVAQVCHVDRCSLERWDGDRVVPLMSQFADGRKQPVLWQEFLQAPDDGPRAVPAHVRAIETLKPVVIDDTAETDLIPRRWIETFGLKSYMVVPLVHQGQVIGVMNLDYCERVTPFEQWQVDLAMTIAGQLALALENSRLYEALRERLRETTTLLRVGQILSEPGESAEVMRKVAQEVGRAFGADMVGAYFMDETKEALVALAGYHVPRDLREWFRTTPMRFDRFPAIVAAFREGRAAWSGNPAQDPRFDPVWTGALPSHSVMVAPAPARGEAIGALFLIWWTPGRVFEASEVALLEAVGRQVGLALENADLTRQTAAKLRETESLLSVSRALSSTLELDTLVRDLLRRVFQIVACDTVGLWMLSDDGEWLDALAGYHVPKDVLQRTRSLRLSIVKHPFYAEAARTKRSVIASDAMNDPRIPDVVKTTAPHRTALFVPVVIGDRMIGGFAAIWWERERAFGESEIALLDGIASQAGVAIEHARLFQENRRQVAELSALYELSRAVTGQLDRAALIEAVHVQVNRVLPGRNMLMVLCDEERPDELELVLRLRDGVRDMDAPGRYAAHTIGLSAVVIRTGRAMRTDRYPEECARHGVTSLSPVLYPYWVGVPLRAGEMILGAVALRSAERRFTEADERLLTNFGDLVALALRSASLFEQRTRAYTELSAAQDQLVRTEKLRALGEMASGVAHDFNNLLAAILGRAQLTLQRVQEPKLRQWLEVIERAALDGAQTVRRLQEFTRIRRDEPLVAVDLNQLVRDALDMTQSRWREEPRSRGVTIDVDVVLDPTPEIAGDAVELREALTNIILNAVDAMPQGGQLAIRSALRADGVELTVSDTGVGMPESVRRRIFDPFFTTKGSRGTGLGLSITYGILSRHGARITVESEEGHGTLFRLSFPPSQRIERAVGEAAVAFPPRTSLRCLVVDDDAAVGGVVGDMLEATGHSAVVLTDGAEAIRLFGAERFDVVFTDLAMPGLSGWDVARSIKAIAPGVPIFMVTGFGVELSEEERLDHGLDAVLVKPLKINDVIDALALVDRKRMKGGASRSASDARGEST